jgi:predicted esterase
MNKLKILCLHGAGQSAKILEQRMAPIIRKLKNIATFIFIDSPFCETKGENEPKRQWWNKTFITETNMWRYDTGKESLAYIEKYIEDHGPFNACIGFSQGTSALQVIPSEVLNKSFTHLILIGGYPLPAIEDLTVSHDFIGKTLNVLGETDTIVSYAKSLELSKLYPSASSSLYSHKKGHCIPVNAEFAATLRTFLNN